MDGIPVEVLSLAAVCGDAGRGARRDLNQVRFGWDAEGPWAAATDAKLFALARWSRPDGDPPAEAVEFGVRPGVLTRLSRLLGKDRALWRETFAAEAGWAELPRHGDGHSVLSRGPVPGDWLTPDLLEPLLTRLRGGAVRGLAPPVFLDPLYLGVVGALAEGFAGERRYEAWVHVRPVRLHGAGWVAELGEKPDGLLNRGLRLWVLVMGSDGGADGVLRGWAPTGGVRPAAAAPVPEFDPVLGGEG